MVKVSVNKRKQTDENLEIKIVSNTTGVISSEEDLLKLTSFLFCELSFATFIELKNFYNYFLS